MPSKRVWSGTAGRRNSVGGARHRAAAQGGFTLIEVVVATVVLALGVSGALATFGAISHASGVASDYDQAAVLAERHLTEVLATGETPVAESGDFGEDAPRFRWEQEVLPDDTGELLEVRVTVSWQSGTATHSVVVSTYVLAADMSDATTSTGTTSSE